MIYKRFTKRDKHEWYTADTGIHVTCRTDIQQHVIDISCIQHKPYQSIFSNIGRILANANGRPVNTPSPNDCCTHIRTLLPSSKARAKAR